MPLTLDELLGKYPEYVALSERIEAERHKVDTYIALDDTKSALKTMLDIDTKMMELTSYHMQLSTAFLKQSKAMTYSEIEKLLNEFIDFPGKDKRHITTTSAILFAQYCVERSRNEA